MAWDDRMKDFRQRRERARAMGGVERLARRAAPGTETVTPAHSKIAGFGTIDGRPVALCSNDFTVLAATSGRVASDKEAKATAPSHARQTPLRVAPREGSDMGTIADLVPEARNRAYDMTKIVRRLCDAEAIFEINRALGARS